MLFNLRHLLSALEIQNYGTISEAAKHIHLTQSAITQGINKLENNIGLSLFNRTNSGLYCTENGSHFLLRVERAFKHLHDFSSMLFATDKIKKNSFVRSITSRQLTALIAITELQSYTAAALRLGLTQPTLHRSIKDLEMLCAQKLFQRSPIGVEPSWRARQLTRYASLFFSELAQALEEIGESNGRMHGFIKIGSLPLAQTEIIPRCVLHLIDEFPQVQVSIVDGPYHEQLHALLHGQLDIIVGALRYPQPHSDIHQYKLFDDPLSIVFRNGHSLAKRSEISDNELQALQWVVPSQGVPARQVFNELFSSRGITPPAALIECSSMVAIRGLLLNSEIAALLPARQVKVEVVNGLLAVCPISLSGTNREIGLTMRKDWQPTQIQKRFLQIIEQHYGTNKISE
jgi:LysR family transcriptional regulator of gallate degradation